MEKLEKTLEEWKAMLDPEQYNVCRLKGTERPFSGKYNDTKTDGVYHCICCNEPLFDSSDQIRFRLRLAELLRADRRQRHGRDPRCQPRHDPHRSGLRQMRCAPGPRVPRRPAADRSALLHQLGVPGPGTPRINLTCRAAAGDAVDLTHRGCRSQAAPTVGLID